MLSERESLIHQFQNRNAAFTGRRTRIIRYCAISSLITFIIFLLVITVSYIKHSNNSNNITNSIEEGKNALQMRDNIELNIEKLPLTSPSYRHQMSTATSFKADNFSRIGYIVYHATKKLSIDKYSCLNPINSICDLQELKYNKLCILEKNTNCTLSKYRSLDGSCNNLDHPYEWGVAYTKFRRLLPPCYADGIGEPRSSIYKKPLPPASIVSTLVHRSIYENDPNFTVMLAVWGQFMDHDVTATALSRGRHGAAISCCNTKNLHPECFPVMEQLDKNKTKCMEFVRSAPALTCCLGPREQMNQVSSYLDGSVVYGSDEELAKKLRTLKDGKLDVITTKTGRYLLPISNDLMDGCNRIEMSKRNRYCFLSGDARANENLHLTSMHLLWVRQHNRIASQLALLNPHWIDEELYQETRRFIVAQIQHITYIEFLPIILGNNTLKKYALLPVVKEQFYHGYNGSIDASISNEFAAAAFRFAHTLIPNIFRIYKNVSIEEYVRLHQMLFNPFRLYDDEFDNVLRSGIETPIEASDPYFVDELKQHLFEQIEQLDNTNNMNICGLDLVALNIQRGRDHGLPGYTAWRHFCTLPVPHTFDDMIPYMDADSLAKISQLYEHVDDIDLYTGALAERPLVDSLLGPTATCIIVDQFVRLKQADRFWYEIPLQPQAFTADQLNQIRLTTLASVICQNADAIELLPLRVMQRVTDHNTLIACSTIHEPNLTYWKK